MKCSLVRVACVILISLAWSACQSDADPLCYEVKVIGPDRCGGGTLVSVNRPSEIGNTILYYDGEIYTNVVKVFTKASIPATSIGYIDMRDFDPVKDQEFSGICLALFAPFDVPYKVASFWRENPC